MKRIGTRLVLPILMIVAIAAQPVWSDDLVELTLKNRAQADLVAGVVDHAVVREQNQFLALTTSDQARTLSRAGIEVSLLVSDIKVEEYYLVRAKDRPQAVPFDPQQLGTLVHLGKDLAVMELDRSMVASLGISNDYTATPLSDARIRWFYSPSIIPQPVLAMADFPSDSLVARISQDSIYAMDQRLEDFRTRYIYTDSIIAARDWMVQKFLSWGYTDVTLQPFGWDYLTLHNVVVVKQGYAEPDKVIVIGGHYDSITYGQPGGGPMVFAPGADDNASGTTTTLEIARVLADIPLRKTVVFILFSAEEVGLVGSSVAAYQYASAGTDIEVMYNYDMVGYDPAAAREVSVTANPSNQAYALLTADAASRVTALTPVVGSSPGGSDHMSFMDQGYTIVNTIENEFNYPGWHTNIDLTTEMDFFYLTEVVKMALASLAYVADAAHPTEITDIIDQGDGQSVEVYWSDCDPSYAYTIYWGLSSGVYTDSVVAPSGACSQIVSGLPEGVLYYFTVIGAAPSGYPAVYGTEESEMSLVVPRRPEGLVASPELNSIVIDWADNNEADLAFYRVYRQADSAGWELLSAEPTVSMLQDVFVVGQTRYEYRITAVDFDGYESEISEESASFAATFNGGLLAIDETAQTPITPTQEEQEAFFDTVFAAVGHSMEPLDWYGAALRREIAGQYSSLFWFDDDPTNAGIPDSEDSLRWYCGYDGNLLISGHRTIQFWGSGSFGPGDFRYDELGLDGFVDNPTQDFAGAHGQNGWPTVAVDPDNALGYFSFVPSLVARSGAEVILTYDSDVDNPASEGTPVGLLVQTEHGYRVFLAFPVMRLTTASATALMMYAATLFGETESGPTYGDVDQNGRVDIADITYYVAYLFTGGPPPPVLNAADADGSCELNVGDLTRLVGFLFLGGADPVEGCVE